MGRTKKNGVSKRTYDRNVLRFAKESGDNWNELVKFVKKHSKKKERDAFADELTKLIDAYSELTSKILVWCSRNGVDAQDVFCDVMNKWCERRGDYW